MTARVADLAKPRRGKRPLQIAGAVALLLVALLAVLEWQQWPFLRGPMERAGTAFLGRQVSLGPGFGLRLFGHVRLRTDHLVIGARPDDPVPAGARSTARPVLDAHHLDLSLPYATLWAAATGRNTPPRITRLDVDRMDLNLVRNAEGRSNWQLPDTNEKPKDPQAEAPAWPVFERLTLKNGAVRYDDVPLRLSLDAAVRTREGESTAASAAAAASSAAPGSDAPAGLEVTAQGSFRDQPVKLALRTTGLLPLAAAAGEDGPAVPIDLKLETGRTRLSIEGTGRSLVDLAALDARFDLQSPSLASFGEPLGVTLPTTSPFTTRGRIRKTEALWNVAVEDFSVGTSKLRGEFRYDAQRSVPLLSGTLSGPRLVLLDLGPAIGTSPTPQAEAAAQRAKSAANGRVLPQRELDIPSLRVMDADIRIQLDALDLGTEQLAKLSPLNAHLLLQNGVLSVQDLLARSSGGELRGAVKIDARNREARWDTDLRWSGVRLDTFVKPRNPVAREASATAANPASKAAAKPAAKTAPNAAAKAGGKRADAPPDQPGFVDGSLSGHAKLSGSGRSTADVLASLGGDITMWVTDGHVSHLLVELTGLDLADSLGLLASGDTPLPMRCAVLRFAVQRGRAASEVGVIDTPDSTLLISGGLSLVDEQLNLVLTAKPKDASIAALRTPVHVEGTLGAPAVRVEAAKIGLRVAAAAALATLTPLASVLALIDFGDPQRELCTNALQGVQAPAKGRPQASPKH
jgi:AsmA family protein